jgi:hypothetical protein
LAPSFADRQRVGRVTKGNGFLFNQASGKQRLRKPLLT